MLVGSRQTCEGHTSTERGETDNDTEDVGRSRRKGNVLVGSRQTCEGHTSTERGETDNDTEDVGRSRRKGNVLVGSRLTCEGHTHLLREERLTTTLRTLVEVEEKVMC